MNIHELIDMCSDTLDAGNCTDDVAYIVETFFNMLKPIEDFIDETGTDCTYPTEYLHRNKVAREAALDALARVIEVLEEY